MRAVLLTLLAAAGLGVPGAAAFVWFGVHDVAATSPHWPLTYWVMETARVRSVKVRAIGIEPPAGVTDDAKILADLHTSAKPFGDKATIMQSQTYYLDVTALAANKGYGITLLAKAMDTPLAVTCAIGDQANDVPMFARAGLSIAMGQGPAEVRAKADEVTASNDADGVAQAISRIILGDQP